MTDLELALELADLADAVSMSRYGQSDLQVTTKPDMTPVSDADQSVERRLRERLAQARPDDALVGEEYGGSMGAGRAWVIDPIDGTKNFVRRVPVWATLIALTVDGVAELGVVSAPALGRRWWAATGTGVLAHRERVGPDPQPGQRRGRPQRRVTVLLRRRGLGRGSRSSDWSTPSGAAAPTATSGRT